MIHATGFYELTESEYHGDPCPQPSLSHSIARRIIERTPLHGWAAHPKSPLYVEADRSSKAMDDGTILHSMILGAGATFEPIMARYDAKHKRAGEIVDDMATNAAKEAAAAIRENGAVPVLFHRLHDLRAIAAEARSIMEDMPMLAGLFAPGKAEQAMIWKDGQIWCRSKIDWMPDDEDMPLIDLKTTALSVAPADYGNRFVEKYATQQAFYQRGLECVAPARIPAMIFAVVEITHPVSVAVYTAHPELLDWASGEMAYARKAWGRGLEHGRWPSYSRTVPYAVELPAYVRAKEDTRHADREYV